MYPCLSVHLFARTSPDSEVAYEVIDWPKVEAIKRHPPSKHIVGDIAAALICVLFTVDMFIFAKDREAIGEALHKKYPTSRGSALECAGADHSFMCEALCNFNPQA